MAEVVADHRHVGPRLQQRDCAAKVFHDASPGELCSVDFWTIPAVPEVQQWVEQVGLTNGQKSGHRNKLCVSEISVPRLVHFRVKLIRINNQLSAMKGFGATGFRGASIPQTRCIASKVSRPIKTVERRLNGIATLDDLFSPRDDSSEKSQTESHRPERRRHSESSRQGGPRKMVALAP